MLFVSLSISLRCFSVRRTPRKALKMFSPALPASFESVSRSFSCVCFDTSYKSAAGNNSEPSSLGGLLASCEVPPPQKPGYTFCRHCYLLQTRKLGGTLSAYDLIQLQHSKDFKARTCSNIWLLTLPTISHKKF